MEEHEIYYINRIHLVINYPSVYIPRIKTDEIRNILIEVISGYFEGEVSFPDILAISNNFTNFKKIKRATLLDKTINNVLSAIKKLSQEQTISNKEVSINKILMEQLDHLLQS
jgi:hypothetical protein